MVLSYNHDMQMLVISHESPFVDPEDEILMDSAANHHFKLISPDKKHEMSVSLRPNTPEIDKLYAAFVSKKPIEVNVRWRDTGESLLAY